MHANLRRQPRFKQRFEFGALGVRGSRWATDRPKAVQRLNELAHTAGVPCAGAPASLPCRGKESKTGNQIQQLNVAGSQPPDRSPAKPPSASWRVVPLGSLRSPSFHTPPRGNAQEGHHTGDESDIEENI